MQARRFQMGDGAIMSLGSKRPLQLNLGPPTMIRMVVLGQRNTPDF